MRDIVYFIIVIALIAVLCLTVSDRNKMEQKLNQAEEEIILYQENLKNVQTEVNLIKEQNIALETERETLTQELEKVSREKEAISKELDNLISNRPETPIGCEEVVAHYLEEINLLTEKNALAEKELMLFKTKIVPSLELEIQNYKLITSELEASLSQAEALLQSNQSLISDLRRSSRNNSINNKFLKAGLILTAGVLTWSLLK